MSRFHALAAIFLAYLQSAPVSVYQVAAVPSGTHEQMPLRLDGWARYARYAKGTRGYKYQQVWVRLGTPPFRGVPRVPRRTSGCVVKLLSLEL